MGALGCGINVMLDGEQIPQRRRHTFMMTVGEGGPKKKEINQQTRDYKIRERKKFIRITLLFD